MGKLKCYCVVFGLTSLRLLSLVSLLLILSIDCYAIEAEKHTSWNQDIQRTVIECNSVADMNIPIQDQFDEAISNQIACDASKYYYGIRTEIDYIKARQCAIESNYKDVLIMLYANGKGVAKNIDLAIHLECGFPIITIEHIKRIEHLMQLKAGKKYKKNFDMCDDKGSNSVNLCIIEEVNRQVRNLQWEIDIYISHLNIKEPRLITDVRKRADNYIDSRAFNETDEPVKLFNDYKNLFELLKNTVNCNIPEYDNADYTRADTELNKLFQVLRNSQRLKKSKKS